MKITLSLIAICLVMITVNLYTTKAEAQDYHNHNYADQNHSHQQNRNNYADRNHRHNDRNSNYADQYHDHRGDYANQNHTHAQKDLDKYSIKRIIESCRITSNNTIDC